MKKINNESADRFTRENTLWAAVVPRQLDSKIEELIEEYGVTRAEFLNYAIESFKIAVKFTRGKM